jgi:hypothetical protein
MVHPYQGADKDRRCADLLDAEVDHRDVPFREAGRDEIDVEEKQLHDEKNHVHEDER